MNEVSGITIINGMASMTGITGMTRNTGVTVLNGRNRMTRVVGMTGMV